MLHSVQYWMLEKSMILKTITATSKHWHRMTCVKTCGSASNIHQYPIKEERIITEVVLSIYIQLLHSKWRGKSYTTTLAVLVKEQDFTSYKCLYALVVLSYIITYQ